MNDLELIEYYLSQKMTAKESEDFENRLESDPEFKLRLEEHQKLQQSFDLLLEEDVKSVIKGLGQKQEGSNKKNKTVFLKLRNIAAALVILFGAAFLMNPEPSGQEVLNGIVVYDDGTERSSGNDKIQATQVQLDINKLRNYLSDPDEANVNSRQELIDGLLKKQLEGLQKERLDWYHSLHILSMNKQKGKERIEKIAKDSNHEYNKDAKKVLNQFSFFKRLFSKFSF